MKIDLQRTVVKGSNLKRRVAICRGKSSEGETERESWKVPMSNKTWDVK